MRDFLPGLGEKSSGDGDMKKAGSGKGELDIVCLSSRSVCCGRWFSQNNGKNNSHKNNFDFKSCSVYLQDLASCVNAITHLNKYCGDVSARCIFFLRKTESLVLHVNTMVLHHLALFILIAICLMLFI